MLGSYLDGFLDIAELSCQVKVTAPIVYGPSEVLVPASVGLPNYEIDQPSVQLFHQKPSSSSICLQVLTFPVLLHLVSKNCEANVLSSSSDTSDSCLEVPNKLISNFFCSPTAKSCAAFWS